MTLLKEFCAENMQQVPAAISAGARRIELCDNLAVGGTTPSYGVIKHAVRLAHAHDVDVMVMCRPRGGNFVYDDTEREMLVDDIRCARSLGATGVVFGCVRQPPNATPALDDELTTQLVLEAKGEGKGIAAGSAPVQVTFHMAFDVLDEPQQRVAIDTLASLGVDRILTHGGPAQTPIDKNLNHLARLIAYAANRVIILPGGGITWKNAERIASTLNVQEVHGTRIVPLDHPTHVSQAPSR